MTIGSSIALIVLGAILAFGMTFELAGVDLDVVGFIMMAAGAIGLVLGLFHANRSRSRTTVVENQHEPGVDRQVREERVV